MMAWAIPADAYQPVLHEYIPPDDREDVTFAATTADGDLPAALDTPSGVVHAPDPARPPSGAEKAYREPLSQRAVYRPDRDTRRPSSIHYDDPFVPSVAPFKRLRAYDAVANDYALGTRDGSLARVSFGGAAQAEEDEFYADLVVDFEAGSSVLIPSVAPGARILRQHTTPPATVEIWRDSAENWYARAPLSLRDRVHLVLQIAAPRAAFGGQLSMPSWEGLAPVAPLPPRPARAFARVKAALGLSRALSPADALSKMVSYFRSFVPSEEPPIGYDDIYVDLALSQKGVCRHRAFAFLVTALGLGIPARMVTNEAHAWVEVRGATIWQRIDLGGAAAMIEEEEGNVAGVAYTPPPDAFPWPGSAESGSGRTAAMRARQSTSGGGVPGRGRSSAGPSPSPQLAPGSSDPAAANRSTIDLERAPPASPEEEARPLSHIVVQEGEVRVHGGAALPVAGTIEVEGTGCGQLRADIALRRRDTGRTTMVGSLITDASGTLRGSVFLPVAFPVGDYDVIVSTAGDARCGAGSSTSH
jgi:transglutaminase-like putative cysteine protease